MTEDQVPHSLKYLIPFYTKAWLTWMLTSYELEIGAAHFFQWKTALRSLPQTNPTYRPAIAVGQAIVFHEARDPTWDLHTNATDHADAHASAINTAQDTSWPSSTNVAARSSIHLNRSH